MTAIKTLTTFILIILTFISCGYRMARVEAIDGKKYWIRDYYNSKKEERYRDKKAFKYSHGRQKPLEKYIGQISSDTVHNSTYVQFDSVRVYLFRGADKYKSIFTSGLLSGQMLYCKMDSLCTPPQGPKITDTKTGLPITQSLFGWAGHTITIDYFEELTYLKNKPTQRKFKFWVYPYKIRFNGGNTIFILELTNPQATTKTDMETFIKGATVTFLDVTGIMI